MKNTSTLHDSRKTKINDEDNFFSRSEMFNSNMQRCARSYLKRGSGYPGLLLTGSANYIITLLQALFKKVFLFLLGVQMQYELNHTVQIHAQKTDSLVR